MRLPASADIQSRGKIALFVGGTPFYLKALLCGLFPLAARPMRNCAARLEAEAANEGREAFHARLASVDAESARRLHPNDVRRVVRAMEVWRLTGKPLSAMAETILVGRRAAAISGGFMPLHRCSASRYCTRVSTGESRQCLPRDGWRRSAGCGNCNTPSSQEASQALGYREICEYLEGRRTLTETIAEVQLRTRQYAKRQLTWFRSLPGLEFCDAKLTFERWADRMA